MVLKFNKVKDQNINDQNRYIKKLDTDNKVVFIVISML